MHCSQPQLHIKGSFHSIRLLPVGLTDLFQTGSPTRPTPFPRPCWPLCLPTDPSGNPKSGTRKASAKSVGRPPLSSHSLPASLDPLLGGPGPGQTWVTPAHASCQLPPSRPRPPAEVSQGSPKCSGPSRRLRKGWPSASREDGPERARRVGGTLRGQGLGPVSQRVGPLPHSWRRSRAGSLLLSATPSSQVTDTEKQGSERRCPSPASHSSSCQRQSEAHAAPVLPEPARRRGAALPAPSRSGAPSAHSGFSSPSV